MKKRLQSWFLFYLPPFAYMAAIFCVSAMPNPTFQGETPDYVLHAVEYFLLALLLLRALLSRGLPDGRFAAWQRVCLLGALCAVAYGLTDELHQYVVPGRHCSLHDVFADAFGAFAAYGVGCLDYVVWQRVYGLNERRPRLLFFKWLSYAAYMSI